MRDTRHFKSGNKRATMHRVLYWRAMNKNIDMIPWDKNSQCPDVASISDTKERILVGMCVRVWIKFILSKKKKRKTGRYIKLERRTSTFRVFSRVSIYPSF